MLTIGIPSILFSQKATPTGVDGPRAGTASKNPKKCQDGPDLSLICDEEREKKGISQTMEERGA